MVVDAIESKSALKYINRTSRAEMNYYMGRCMWLPEAGLGGDGRKRERSCSVVFSGRRTPTTAFYEHASREGDAHF